MLSASNRFRQYSTLPPTNQYLNRIQNQLTLQSIAKNFLL